MHDISLLVLYFFAYALLGRIVEFFYYLIFERRLQLANFLRLPILPIYGIGAMTILLLIAPFVSNPLLLFILSMAAATIIEYVGHILIDKLFHVELWNYSHQRFNFQGRVALPNSTAFGILALLLVYVIHPFVSQYAEMIPPMIAMIIALSLLILLAVDLANSTTSLTRLRFSRLRGTIAEVQSALLEQLAKLAPDAPIKVRLRRLRSAFLKLHRANLRRLEKAFPGLRFSARRKGSKR